jgi:predicted ester cyclase
MVGTDNKSIFRQLYEDAWNSGDLTVVDELLAADSVNHEVVEDTTTPHRELYKRAVVETRIAFPDWALYIEDMIAEGDRVVARWRAHGTHWSTGEL